MEELGNVKSQYQRPTDINSPNSTWQQISRTVAICVKKIHDRFLWKTHCDCTNFLWFAFCFPCLIKYCS